MLNRLPVTKPLLVRSLNNQPLHEEVKWTAKPLLLTIGNHCEEVSFLVIRSPAEPRVLGIDWLKQHNPHVIWATSKILGWDPACYALCLQSVPQWLKPIGAPDPEFPAISNFPSCYLDLKEVFNKERATSLLPHRPFDCAIKLLPGISPSRGHLYSLSAPESEAMQKYIGESLVAGLI